MFGFPRLVQLAFLTGLAVSFVGGLTAGLGMGFDLGTQWPGPPETLIVAALRGSLEPVHRFLTVAAGVLYVAVLAYAFKARGRVLALAASAVGFLVATALTGRMVLLVLGGEVPPPYSYAVYPLNNALALFTVGAMALLWAMLTPAEPADRAYLYRGAAAWGFLSSVTGAYMLGYHKITREQFQYSLWPPTPDPVWALHILGAALMSALGAAALLLDRKADFWRLAFATSLVAQPLTGLLMIQGASADPWAPGVQTGFHAVFAHLAVISSFVIYAKSRYGRR